MQARSLWRDPTAVVPAKAGTHTPCTRDDARSAIHLNACVYGSPPARGRHWSVTRVRTSQSSLRLGAGGLHDHRPALLIEIDERGVFLGRAWRRLGAVGGEAALDLVRRERLAQRLVQPI